MKKTGDSAKVVDRAKSVAQTKPGTVGVKVSILPPSTKFSDRIAIKEYSQGGIERTITRARIEGEMELELIPDDTLLKYLQKEAGYRFPEIMMFTQDFIGDKQRARTCLYNDWGVMHGRTQVMPIKEFFRIKAEQEG